MGSWAHRSHSRLAPALLGACAAALALTACATPEPPSDVAAALDRASVAARDHLEVGNSAEGAQLIETVLRLDREHRRALSLRETLPERVEYLYGHPYLGSNFARRPQVERPPVQRVLLYLPDRILDLLDVLSFDLHFGLPAHVNLHLTRAVQLGGGVRSTVGVGWHDHRSLGGLVQAESGITLLPVGANAYAGALAGTSGATATADGIAGLHSPSDRLYQQMRDYWAIGFELTAGVGFEFELHTLDLADFLLGWFGVDFLNDDFARTRGSRLRDEDLRLIRAISELERSPERLEAYRRSLEPPAGIDAIGSD